MAQTTGIINGTDLVVFVHNGGSAGSIADYTAIAHLTNCSFSPTMSTREITSKSSGGKAKHAPGTLNFTASAEGLYSHDATYGYSQLNPLFLAGTELVIMFGDPTDGANIVHKFSALITSLPITAPMEDNATYSAEFLGSGDYDYEAASGLF